MGVEVKLKAEESVYELVKQYPNETGRLLAIRAGISRDAMNAYLYKLRKAGRVRSFRDPDTRFSQNVWDVV
jgi:DNA-binding IscR family transcriptional regulator